jgi:tetratricopeptide (TPR) repeat protein
MLRELHSRAADFHSRENGDAHEAMHHLIQANRIEEARNFALAHSDALLASDNQEELASIMELVLWGGCESVELMELSSNIMDRAGKWERAGKIALEIEKCVPGTAIAIKSKILRANILGKTGELKKSLSVLDEIDGYADDSELPARIQYVRSSTLRRLGRIEEAKKACKKAIALSKGPKMISLHAECEMEKAMIMTSEGEHQKALIILESARKDFEKLENVQDVIRCDINLGMVLRACDRIEEAIPVLEKAAKASEDAGLNRFKAHALANLTDLLNRSREFERSANLAREAISIFTGLGEPLMQAAAMLNLCGAEAGLGRKEPAMEIMDQAIELLEERDLLKTRGAWLAECADILKGMGEHARVDELLERYSPQKK